jgi:hypothetical protein
LFETLALQRPNSRLDQRDWEGIQADPSTKVLTLVHSSFVDVEWGGRADDGSASR